MSEFKAKITAELDTSKVEQQLNELGKDKKIKIDVDTNNTEKNIGNVNKSINTAEKSATTFGNTLKKSLNIGSAAAITYKSIQLISRALKEGYQSAKEIDAALTQVKIVTGASNDALNKYASDAAKAAKEIGASITEIIKSTETFARLGYSLSDSLDLSTLVGKYANVASTTVDDATESLTAIMKAFNIAPAQMEGVVDELVKVGQEYAVSDAELGQALQNGGAALQAGGNTLEESIALIAAGNAAVQNASAVGTTLKTVSMRVRSSTAELEAMGETVDDLVKSTSDYRAEIKALSGVDIMLDENTYKSTYQILTEISKVWDNLTDIQQATLLEDLAGKRNANVVKSIITNLNDLEGAYQSATNATGTLAAANADYMESIGAKISQLKAAFESLAMDSFSTEMFGGLVDATTNLVTFIDKTNLLKGSLAGLAAAGAIKGFTLLATGISNAALKLNEFNAALKLVKAGNIGEAEIEQLARMTANLSQSQLKAVLSSKALSTEQRMAILTAQGMSEAEAQAALSSMGLATAEGAATATTFSLSGALKGLWATLMANPLVLVIAAVTAAVSIYSTYKQKVEEARQAALDAGNAAKDQAKSIMELYNAYSKANSAYANNTGSKEALESATDELLRALGVEEAEIQRLVEEYGNLDNAINNVTVSALEGELAKLTSGYKASIDTLLKATKDGVFSSFSLLNFSIRDKDSSWFNVDPDSRFADRLRDAGLISSGSYGSAGGAAYLGDNTTFEGVIGIYEKLIAMQEELNKGVADGVYTREELAQDDLYKSIQDRINAFETEYKDVLDYVEKINDAAAQLQYLDYINANGVPETREEFEALQSTLLATAESSGQFVGTTEQINDSIVNTLSNIPELSKYFGDYSHAAETAANKSQAVREAFQSIFERGNYQVDSAEYNKLTDWYMELSDKDKDLVYEITLNTDTAQWDLSKWQQALHDAQFHFSDLIAEQDTDDADSFTTKINKYIDKIQTLQDALKDFNNGELDAADMVELFEEFPELAKNSDNLGDAIRNLMFDLTGYNSVVDDTGNVVSNATGIMAVFEDAFGRVDSEEDRQQLQAFMDAVLELGQVVGSTEFSIDIEAETNGMEKLWTAMKESVSSTGLTAESIKNLKARYQDLDNYNAAALFEKTANGIHLNTKALRELESEYEKQKKADINNNLESLVRQYNDLTEQINRASGTAQAADLYAARQDILDQINDTAELAAMYDGLTSAFYKWEQAQSIGEEGDMYDSLSGSLENIKQLYDDGLIGTNKFRTAVQLMSNEDLSTASIDELLSAYESGYGVMTRYFQDGSDGCLNFLSDVQKLNSEWAHMNEDGSWEINFGVGNDQEIADALGINVESVQAIMRKLSDYGFDINLDSIFSQLDLLETRAEQANQALVEIGATDIVFDFDTNDFTVLDEEIQQAKDLLDSLYDDNGELNVNYNEGDVENAIAIIERLIYRKQSLDDAAILKVDTSNASTDIETIISKLQDFKASYNNLEVQTAIGADTTEAQSTCNGLLEEISGMDAEILATLGVDTTNLDTLNESINSITPEVMVTCGLDASLIEDYQAAEHTAEGTVIWDNNISKVTSWIGQSHTATGTVNWGNNTVNVKTHFTATGTINWSGGAGAQGTAFARGNWGTKNGGVALVGELAPEMVVRDGKFFTVGDDGAELFQYKPNDIIFNGEQTKQILENGKITNGVRRGRAYASGTAFSSGSGKITGSGKVKTTPSGNGSKSNNTSKSSNSSSTKEDEPQVIDWIEIAIDRIERAINKLKTTAESTYKALKTKLGATADEITKVNDELTLQSKAYNRYMQEANSVGLSPELAEKVRNGTIDISEYDSETADLISKYREWVEKALDAADAIDTLHESLASLYEDNFENIQNDYEHQLALLEHLTNTYNTGIDALQAKGYLASTQYYAALQNVEKENIGVMEKELADLQAAFSEAMDSGEIEMYSDAWYSFQENINGVKESIAEANVNLLEFAKTMREIEWSYFDYMQDRIGQINQESNFLIDLMSNKQLHGDKGQLTNYGLATAGLRAQNYNVYMAQADKYADEILKIDEELAKDPYNTDLIERREELLGLQQESILAAEGEKDAIVELVREGIQLELDALKDLIDTYKDSLDSAKDLYEYQKKIADKTSDIAALQKQLSAYENDVTEETRAKVQKLQVDLAEAEEDLAETEYEKFISDTKSMLDSLYTEYEQVLNERLDNVDALLQDIVDMVNANATTIGDAVGDGVGNISEYLSGNTQSISDTLKEVTGDVGYTMTKEMHDIWNDSEKPVVSMYGDNISGGIDGVSGKLTTIKSVLDSIEANTAAMAATSNAEAETTVATTTPTTAPTTPKPTETPKTETPKADTTPKATTPTLDDATKHGVAAAIWNGGYGWGTGTTRANRLTEVFGANNGIQALVNTKADINGNPRGYSYTEMRKKFKGYKTGGIVDYTGLAQLDGTPGKPELVLNAKDTQNFLALRDVLREMSQQELSIAGQIGNASDYSVDLSSQFKGAADALRILADLQSNSSAKSNEVTFGDTIIQIDHVQDYNDFVAQLQKDKKFEKMIRAMSTDLLFGGSTLGKYRDRWDNK